MILSKPLLPQNGSINCEFLKMYLGGTAHPQNPPSASSTSFLDFRRLGFVPLLKPNHRPLSPPENAYKVNLTLVFNTKMCSILNNKFKLNIFTSPECAKSRLQNRVEKFLRARLSNHKNGRSTLIGCSGASRCYLPHNINKIMYFVNLGTTFFSQIES